MLWRKDSKEIRNWVNTSDKTALLVTGARQTGKTTLIRNILEEEGVHFHEINFVEQTEIIDFVTKALQKGSSYFISILPLILNKTIEKGDVIFFDEVQECPDIVTAIKFLVDDNTYRYILSGSLLGVEYKNLRSAPVGYLEIIDMFPMTYEEFIAAFGGSPSIIEKLKSSLSSLSPIDDILHKKLMDLFFLYLVVGGMPQAVDKYVTTKDFMAVSKTHSSIMNLYKMDFTRYEEKDKTLRLKKIYDLIPSELDSKNKRYIFSDIDPHFKYDRYENSFNWLIDAGVAIAVHNAKSPEMPLIANLESNLMKLFLSDVGLLSTCFGPQTQLKILNEDDEINNGSIFENFVAQELYRTNRKLYYSQNKKLGEVDFLIEKDGSVIPIEVKSGKEHTKYKALSSYLSVDNCRMNKAYVLYKGNIKVDGNIVYLPIYMAGLLPLDNVSFPSLNIELSGI